MKKKISFILLSASLFACAGQESDSKKSAVAAPPQDPLAEIRALAKTSCQVNDDCASIGVGARPCGGPGFYMVYSKSATDETALKKKAEKYNSEQKSKNKKEGRMGICVVAKEPVLSCSQNQCVAQDERQSM